MLRNKFTKKENTDSGMALALILVFMGLWLALSLFFKIAFGVILISMVLPVIIYPFTFVWLNMSDLMGKIMSKVILSIIYILFVCPVAFIRNMAGKDSLMLRKFKKSNDSAFTDRNHKYTSEDLCNPF